MSDAEFYKGGAMRESAAVPKEDLLTREYEATHGGDFTEEETDCFWWFFEPEFVNEDRRFEGVIPDGYEFDMQGIKSVLDWACTERKPKPYPVSNWVLGMPWSECVRSFLRHKKAIRDGQLNDPDSGLPHEFHAQCNLYYLTVYIATGTGKDDR